MELNDLARLCRFRVGDFEESLREVLVIFSCEEFHCESNVWQFKLLSFTFRPVWMAFDLFLFDDFVEHENCLWLLLPNHEPEVTDSMFEWTLAEDILSLSAFKLHKVGIDVIQVLSLKQDSRMVVWIYVSVSKQDFYFTFPREIRQALTCLIACFEFSSIRW